MSLFESLSPEQKEMTHQLRAMVADHLTGPEFDKMTTQQKLVYMAHNLEMIMSIMGDMLPPDGFALFKHFILTKMLEIELKRKCNESS